MKTNAELRGLWRGVFLSYIRKFRRIQVGEIDIPAIIFSLFNMSYQEQCQTKMNR